MLPDLSITHAVILDAIELHDPAGCGNSLKLASMRAVENPARNHGIVLGDAILNLDGRIGKSGYKRMQKA